MANHTLLKELQQKIDYQFKDENLLFTALTHSSYANEKHWPYEKNNERLEFLGDAVLELISSEQIFRNHPDQPEGDLTRIRASYVCEPTLAGCASRTWQISSFKQRRGCNGWKRKRFYFIRCNGSDDRSSLYGWRL